MIRKPTTPKESCQLLGPVSILIQVFMGVAAIMMLLLKRNYEHPKRKMIVWVYDTGKQISGSLGIHFLNLCISIFKRKKKAILRFILLDNPLSGDDDDDDEQCDWYFLNLLLDTTIGIPILWLILHFLERILISFRIENVQSGNYFPKAQNDDEEDNLTNHHQKPMVSAFIKQVIVFMCGLSIMKIAIFLILNYFEDLAYWFADLILGWSDPWPNLQVFLVMFVFPVLLNCFQYFCVDNIIKLHTEHGLNLENAQNFEEGEFTSTSSPSSSFSQSTMSDRTHNNSSISSLQASSYRTKDTTGNHYNNYGSVKP
ncbi:uncharacterized protein NDAI_0K01310 [Naumovozyma dairenensis CBS 421]|uniref:Vacuolar membrane protein n=1 Tax=Naumovozyma dairenensis (strain ATCC 10597 / BCRC 20456 / CBS 421 / NBRC 0211 / NRRL Y-12639) TaxID=1071378 RepID=G0WHR1_NAUDC|nr:hypothetical protein NDAI_0K01310 [Naumovozyma dairenensis CBS 421]CCD27322.1 hypothetical protein NDAI_0K01310 [Naumovozyma dairenensis CBS 421]